MSRFERVLFGLGFALLAGCGVVGQEPPGGGKPSVEEVRLLLGETDQAMGEYEQLVRHEAALFGDTENVAADRSLLELWSTLREEVSKDPQKFNSARGFDLVVTVDDASRNATLIGKLAVTEMLKRMHSGKGTGSIEALSKLMEDADACGASMLKASEGAADLYTRYLRWQDAATNKLAEPAPPKPARKKP